MTMTDIDPRIRAELAAHPYPLLFVTISGAHLAGFPSPDSDYDVRGVYIVPTRDAVGLIACRETVERSGRRDGLEIDLVTHDIRKFMLLMLRPNGYVMEQLLSPLVVHTTPEHEEMKTIAPTCITRHYYHHYLGFAQNQWRLFAKEDPPRVKPLLYVFRVLLTGIHLMRTGQIEANLLTLNEEARLPYIPDLVARKLAGPEQSTLPPGSLEFYEEEFRRLLAELESARDASQLPEAPSGRDALHDLLVRVRLGQ